MVDAGAQHGTVQPCPRCGALMLSTAARCDLCGAPGAAGGEAGERVKPCLSCGAVLDFDTQDCPECGAATREPVEGTERVKECVRCGALIAFAELYCSRCGEFSVPVGEDDIPVLVDLDGGATWRELLPEILGLCAYAVGIVAISIAGVMLFL